MGLGVRVSTIRNRVPLRFFKMSMRTIIVPGSYRLRDVQCEKHPPQGFWASCNFGVVVTSTARKQLHYHMSYSLDSLHGVTWGIIHGSIIGVIKRDVRSLDYNSYGLVAFEEASVTLVNFFGAAKASLEPNSGRSHMVVPTSWGSLIQTPEI